MDTGSPSMDKGRLMAFLKDLLLKSWGISQLEPKPAKMNNVTADRTLVI
jgi:hypothetical protein